MKQEKSQVFEREVIEFFAPLYDFDDENGHVSLVDLPDTG